MGTSLARITALGLVLSIAACGSSDSKNDSEMENDDSSNAPVESSSLRLKEIVTSSNGASQSVTLEYTAEGNLRSEIYLQDGTAYRIRTYETTPAGLLISRSVDNDIDGIDDEKQYVYNRQYVYNDSGSLIRINRYNRAGLINSVAIFEIQNGLAVSRTFIDTVDVATPELVDVAGGTTVITDTYTYEAGQLVLSYRDSDADGITDISTSYTYNPDGTLASSTTTFLADGAVQTNTYFYEEGVCKRWGNSMQDYYCVNPE